MPEDALDGALAHGAGLLIALEAARAVDAADLMAVGAVHEYGAPGLVHAHHALLLLRLRRCRANAERAPLGGCCCRRRLELQDTALQQYQLVAKRLFGTAPL